MATKRELLFYWFEAANANLARAHTRLVERLTTSRYSNLACSKPLAESSRGRNRDNGRRMGRPKSMRLLLVILQMARTLWHPVTTLRQSHQAVCCTVQNTGRDVDCSNRQRDVTWCNTINVLASTTTTTTANVLNATSTACTLDSEMIHRFRVATRITNNPESVNYNVSKYSGSLRGRKGRWSEAQVLQSRYSY